jgi:hypothetical protein
MFVTKPGMSCDTYGVLLVYPQRHYTLGSDAIKGMNIDAAFTENAVMKEKNIYAL